MTRLAVVGGTFDPVHNGHVQLGEIAHKAFDVSVLFASNSNPYYKDTIASNNQRLQMVQLATDGKPYFLATSLSPDYLSTYQEIDTVIEKFGPFKQEDLLWVLGTDQINSLPTFKQYPLFMPKCTFVFVPRSGYDVDLRDLNNIMDGGKYILLSDCVGDISSTQIRNRMQKGKSIDNLVPEEVAAYIQKHNLYETI